MTKLVDTVIKVAQSQVGVHEGRKNGHWDNDQKYSAEVPGLAWSNFQPWCCTFVSWVAFKAGAGDLYPRTASCDLAGAWFKTKGRWSEYPAVGAQVFYGTARDLNHTGIVVAFDADAITTVEGNTNLNGSPEGDGVYVKTRLRRSANVVGYGYPAFPGGIVSADPAWVTGVKKPLITPPVVKTRPITTGRIDGIDLSHHNTGITLTALKQAKAAGVNFVFHKATEGSGFTDVQYATRRRLAKRAGLYYGAYHFARPSKSGGTAQARQFLKVAQLAPGDMLPVLDLEDDGGLNPVQLGQWVGQFVAECERQLAHAGGIIYTNFNLPQSFGWKLWVARYNDAMKPPNVPDPWRAWDIWQFSNGAYGHPTTVPGVGHCDINTLNTVVGQLRLPVPTVVPPVVTPPVVTPPVESFRAAAVQWLKVKHHTPENLAFEQAVRHHFGL